MTDAAHAEHAEGEHHVNYIAKFWWLVGLTLCEVAAAVVLSGEGQGGLRLGVLAFFALWKAGVVAQYYMHLKSEGIGLKLVAIFPLVLIAILVTAIMTDGVFLNYAAGH